MPSRLSVVHWDVPRPQRRQEQVDVPAEPDPSSGVPDGDLALRADCAQCVGLCCVALPFSVSADFAIDKPALVPCPHLQGDFRCGIHSRLRQKGFRGCTVYDCFGAGQKVTQQTFAGADWRKDPGLARRMFAVFVVQQQLHEMLWYLTEAVTLSAPRSLRDRLDALLLATSAHTDASAEALLQLDVAAYRAQVGAVLAEVSGLVRARALRELRGRSTRGPADRGAELRGADLVGARLAGADLRGANLRGALLIAADLSRADLASADLVGADLRDADLSGADLSRSIFLTGPQVSAARGNASTRLPARIARPAHWSSS
ncbi:MAG: pentapeptide repeat-containing protein [Actinomycetes bacterium]